MDDFAASRARLDLSVEAARERILRRVKPVGPRTRPLTDSLGDVVASDILAPIDLPRFTNSAMDGVAVRATRTAAASPSYPVRLSIAGTIDAGSVWSGNTSVTMAVFIGTGAPLLAGFDAVIPIENVRHEGDSVVITSPIEAGSNVRSRGEDILAGSLAIAKGTVLRAQEIGLLAALGVDTVNVHQRAAISILSTGAELFGSANDARVNDANGPMLSALVAAAGGEVVRTAQSGGEPEDLFDHLNDRSTSLDLVITSGGISNSRADTMTGLLAKHPNAELWDIRLRPGKHFGFAWLDDFFVLALPGNPIAALVGFELFGRLIIERLGGKADSPLGTMAKVTEPLRGKLGRTDAIRGRAWIDQAGQFWAMPTENRGSGVLSSLPDANCLLLLPEDADQAAAEDPVLIHWVGYQ